MAHANIEMLRIAVENLENLKDELVFVGGCTTGLMITDEGAAEPRETKDVDTIVGAVSYAEYNAFSEKLKKIKFREDTREGAPTCRWVKGSTILDVMPLDKKTLGFTNIWYRPAMATAERRELIPGVIIRVVSPAYFCATKMEAFEGRGKDDFFGSHDLEDIIAVIDGREELIAEIENAPADVRHYIAGKVADWLEDNRFTDALPGHLGSSDQNRFVIVMERLKKISSFKEN